MKLLRLLLCLAILPWVGNTKAQYFETCSEHQEFQYKLQTSSCDYYFSERGMSVVLKQNYRDSGLLTMRYDVSFVGANTGTFESIDQMNFKKRRFYGNKIEDIQSYRSLKLSNVWDGIDILFNVDRNGNLKYDFYVTTGNYKDVALKYEGLSQGVIEDKSLMFYSDFGTISQAFPEVYTKSKTQLNEQSLLDFELVFHKNVLSFNVEDYDKNLDLVIDPWCTYFGGGDIDEAYGLAVDSAGNSVITGYTFSSDLPITAGAIDTAYDIDYDAYIAKFDPSGDLLWATYYGGNGGDYGRKVKLDAQNNVYATGNTTSTDLLTSPGAYQPANAGSYDAYLLKLSPNGGFVWATLFGGTGGDFGMVEDLRNDKVVISGFTSSTNLPANGFQTTLGGAVDSYLAVFDTSGNYEWSTYFGGTNSEDMHAITFDYDGNIIAVGDTYSNDMPITTGAFQMNNNGSHDVYILKTSPTGTKLFATYFGGYGKDDALGVCTDEDNRIYIAGYSQSSDFPVSTGAHQTSLNSGRDGMIARFTPTGHREYCTFYGGDDNEDFTGMVNQNGKIYLVMNSRSTDLLLHGVSHQTSNLGYAENFILVMDTSFNFAYSTYFGGVSSESSYEIDVTHDEVIYISGFSSGADLAFGSGIFQNSPIGSTDAYVLRLDSLEGTFNALQEFSVLNFEVYPNPTRDQLSLNASLNSINSIEIIDAGGKLQMLIHNPDPKELIDVSGLANGTYFIRLISDNQVLRSSFTKL